MVGLGEACSHIAAILFALDANSQAKKELSCTPTPVTGFHQHSRMFLMQDDCTAPAKKRQKILNNLESS